MMLVLKNQFLIDPIDGNRFKEIDKLMEGRTSRKFTAAECAEINAFWDKYPIDGWVDGIGPKILETEMSEVKGQTQKKERVKLVILMWVSKLPFKPTLNYMWGSLMHRYAFRRICQMAYIYTQP